MVIVVAIPKQMQKECAICTWMQVWGKTAQDFPGAGNEEWVESKGNRRQQWEGRRTGGKECGQKHHRKEVDIGCCSWFIFWPSS